MDKETVQLEPAQMFCNIQKMNAVVDFKAYALYADETNHILTNNSIAIGCSSELPTIALEAITDDGRAFTPSIDGNNFNLFLYKLIHTITRFGGGCYKYWSS